MVLGRQSNISERGGVNGLRRSQRATLLHRDPKCIFEVRGSYKILCAGRNKDLKHYSKVDGKYCKVTRSTQKLISDLQLVPKKIFVVLGPQITIVGLFSNFVWLRYGKFYVIYGQQRYISDLGGLNYFLVLGPQITIIFHQITCFFCKK